ncbi:MAG: hypothetical protein ACKV2T_42470 [Kofleriaceae bacterium]
MRSRDTHGALALQMAIGLGTRYLLVVSTDPDDVPKIPYGRGLKLDSAMMFRIGATLALLILLVLTMQPCADATSKFVTDFDDKKGSASDKMPKPGTVDKLEPEYEKMGGTPEEDRAAYERAMAKARRDAASTGNGSAGSGSAGSGTRDNGSAGSGRADSAGRR